MTKHTLDARHVLCPLPVIRCQDKVAKLEKGDLLEVTCTDPGALSDIPMWSRINGHLVLETKEEGNDVIVLLEVEGLNKA